MQTQKLVVDFNNKIRILETFSNGHKKEPLDSSGLLLRLAHKEAAKLPLAENKYNLIQ